MRQPNSAMLPALETQFEMKRGRVLPLPPRLARLYGTLRMPMPRSKPHVFSNFVSTLDGVVSFNTKGHASGGDISGFSAQDRMVMGLLRAIADVVIIGAGTLDVDRRHVWTAEAIFPALANDFGRLRQALCKRNALLNVIVSGSGAIDLRLPVFVSGKVQVLIVTTIKGAKQLRKQKLPDSVEIRAILHDAGAHHRSANRIAASDVLEAVGRMSPGGLILVEGGPRLLGDFYAEGLLDEQFLTLAPQIAGRGVSDRRLSLVMGTAFAPGGARWGTLTDVRRVGSHLFLRYRFSKQTRTQYVIEH
jgi:riboflavin biosynthesis pyrimidine reductase